MIGKKLKRMKILYVNLDNGKCFEETIAEVSLKSIGMLKFIQVLQVWDNL